MHAEKNLKGLCNIPDIFVPDAIKNLRYVQIAEVHTSVIIVEKLLC